MLKTLIIGLFLLVLGTIANAQVLSSFKDSGGRFGFKDASGKIIVPAKYDSVGFFSEGLAYVNIGYNAASRQNGKFGFIDVSGKLVVSLKYDYAAGFSGGLAKVALAGKYGFIDRTGRESVPLRYESAGDFYEGLAWVKLNGKFGYIDNTGNQVVPFHFESGNNFKNGVALVRDSGRYHYIDTTGKDLGATPPAKASLPQTGRPDTNKARPKASEIADMSAVTDTLSKVFDKAVGKWSVTLKDKKYGLPMDYEIEIKNVAKGKAEVWQLENGAPYKKFNSFEFLNLMGQLRFVFEYSSDDKNVSRGEGYINQEMTRMSGKQLSARGGITLVDEWTATKKASAPPAAVVSVGQPKAPSAPAANDKLVGVWAVTTKDHQSGAIGKSKFEIRMVNGNIEAWRVVNGKADIKYTGFKVFDDRAGLSFNFELNVPPGIKSEGTGTIAVGTLQMKGTQIVSVKNSSIAFTHDFSAIKESTSLASVGPSVSKPQKTVSNPGPTRSPASNTPFVTSKPVVAEILVAAKPFKNLDGKYGFHDESGKVAIRPIFDYAFAFDVNDASVVFKGDPLTMRGLYGVIDKKGKEIVPMKYAYIGLGDDGVYAFRNADGKMGLINSQGRELAAPVFDSIFVNRDGMRMVKLSGKSGFIDNNGRLVVEAELDDAGEFFAGRAAAKKNGKWGFIDKTGRTIVPFEFDHAKAFIQGHAAVSRNGKYGFVNESGKLVIDFQFEDTGLFSEGFAFVKKGGKWGYIDTAGKAITEFKYDSNTNYDRFENGMAIVIHNGKRGYIDKTGREIIVPQYDNALPFRNGKAKVRINGREFFIDKSGAEVK